MKKLKSLDKFSVDLKGKNISDLIYEFDCKYRCYKNLMTGEESSELNDVLRGRKFLLLREPFNVNADVFGYTYGYYAETITVLKETYVALLLLRLNLRNNDKCYWEEVDRIFVPVDAKNYKKESLGMFGIKDLIDVCGQSLFTWKDCNHLIILNCVDGARKELIKAFPSKLLYHIEGSDNSKNTVNIFGTDTDISRFCTAFGAKQAREFATDKLQLITQDYKRMDAPDLELPKHAYDKLMFVAKAELNYIEQTAKHLGNLTNGNNGIMKMSYLQRCGDKFLLRNFVPYYTYSYAKNLNPEWDHSFPFTADIELIEYERIEITDDMPRHTEILENRVIVCRDEDVKGTFLEHTAQYIDHWTKFLYERIESIGQNPEYYSKERIYSLSFSFLAYIANQYHTYRSEGIHPSNILQVLVNFCQQPVLEKIFNMNCQLFLKMRENLTDNIGRIASADTFCSIYFGSINYKETELHKMLGMPKGMLEYVADNNLPLNIAREFKLIFESDPQYFMRMNRVEYEDMFKEFQNIYIAGTVPKDLKHLVEMYGPNNIIGYMTHLRRFTNGLDTNLNSYLAWSCYIEKLYVIKNAGFGDGADWKLSGDKLKAADAAINDAYYLCLDKDEYNEAAKKFKSLYKEWKKYEYKTDKLQLIVPKAPSDIVKEGIALNHCVKEFVNAVANGETFIFFIRKNSNPDKSYYTLEIRDGKVRQCHGKNNYGYAEGDWVDCFLKEFCMKKHIKLPTGNEALGVYS